MVTQAPAVTPSLASRSECLHDVTVDGWKRAYFKRATAAVLGGDPLVEDIRSADWRYFLPLDRKKDALVVGVGGGTIPMALADHCRMVVGADQDRESLRALCARTQEQGRHNVRPVLLSKRMGLPFAPGSFDSVVATAAGTGTYDGASLRRFIEHAHALLKPAGVLYLTVGNRLDAQRLFRPARAAGASGPCTLGGYKRLLQAAGFVRLRLYAPLPRHDGIPLFHVPLEHPQALRFFLRNVFPLFETVSPEVKRRYAVEYAAAKVGVRLALALKLTGLMKLFVPGFGILAEKAA